jgi:hypothetical protein
MALKTRFFFTPPSLRTPIFRAQFFLRMDHILKPKGSRGTADAFYCRECVVQESDRDGCPRVVNLGVARMDLFYHRKEREKGAE